MAFSSGGRARARPQSRSQPALWHTHRYQRQSRRSYCDCQSTQSRRPVARTNHDATSANPRSAAADKISANHGRPCCTGAATAGERTTQSGLGPSEASALAGRNAGQHRRRIRAARPCRRRFPHRGGAQCAPHTGTTYPPSSLRLGSPTRITLPLAVRDRACAVCATGCQSHHDPTKSLSRPAEMRKGVGGSNPILHRTLDKRPDGKGLQSGTGPNSQRMYYGPRVAGLRRQWSRRQIIDRTGRR